MCHFDITVDWTNRLAGKACILDREVRANRFTGQWVCLVDTGIDIRVAKWVYTIEFVVRTAIPEVALVEDGVDHRWRIASSYLECVDALTVEGGIGTQSTSIHCGVCEAEEVDFEDTLRTNDVI